MKSKFLKIAVFVVAATINGANTAEEPKPPAGEPFKREAFSDPVAGYSLVLPTGYRKLSDEEMHFVFKGLSKYLGKEGSERAIKRPPTYFLGPGKDAKDKPPSLAIAFSENDQQFSPAQIPLMKTQLEEQHKQQGDKVGEFEVKVVKVDGLDSIQVENDFLEPISNERNRMIRVAVPAKGKWIEILFNFSLDQTDAVHGALKETLDSFKVMEHPPANIANQDKWWRIAYITLGSGAAGLLIGLLLQRRKKSAPA